MRKFFLLIMILCVSLAVMAGDKLTAPTKAFLAERMGGTQDDNSTLVKPKAINGVQCVDCFIFLKGASVAELEKAGVTVTGKYSTFVTAQVPIDKIEEVARLGSVTQVAIARTARHFTDEACGVVNADKVWDGTNNGLPESLTGKDVVLGIIDEGIEFNHRAFLDDDGNSRVKAIYKPNETNAGTGGTKISVDGVELPGYAYTTAEAIAAQTTDNTNADHGTHTTGCAGASKVGVYSGMAPECDLVLCGLGNDLTDVAIVNSANFIADYAQSVGKPCVISISLGSDIGAHDGTSGICLGFDEVAEKYGAVILLAAGNEADATGYATKTLESDEDAMAVVHTPVTSTALYGSCDIWNSTSDELKVEVVVLNPSGAVKYRSIPMNNGTINASTMGLDGTSITISGGVDQNNNRYNIYIYSKVYTYATSGTGNNRVAYIITGKGGNVINVFTDNYGTELASTGVSISGVPISLGTSEGSFSDDVTASKVISVGAMASRSTSNGSYSQGDIAYFSSYGTDFNGVDHPFITAPGHYVIAPINRYYKQSGVYSVTYNGKTDYWDQKSGTSMATPITAGVVALLLQADPTLTVEEVKDALKNTATAYVNPQSPPKQRGNGIVNALDAAQYVVVNSEKPKMFVTPASLDFEVWAGDTCTSVINVKGKNLVGDVTITSSDSNFFVTPSTITAAQAEEGVDVTVSYAPAIAGSHQATITVATDSVESKIVEVNGLAKEKVPVLSITPELLNFATSLTTSSTKYIEVSGMFINDDVTITLDDENGVFSVSPLVIPAGSITENEPVMVEVTFTPSGEGNFKGAVTLNCPGDESKVVMLNASASDYATASSSFLDIAKYVTIDEAGWNTDDIPNLYQYKDYPEEECGWLTVSNYGVVMADATQNWFTNSIIKTYETTWSSNDVFLGSESYFGNNTSYAANFNGNYQRFYVTNCSQVKQYGYHRNVSNYPLKMNIYECTVNDDGSLTAGTTAIQTQKSTVNGLQVVASNELDANKVYKVEIYNNYSYIYEIGFKTPLQTLDVPVATDATDIAATSFVANWEPCYGATSYILRVTPKPEPALLLTETFAKFTSEGNSNIGPYLDNYMDNMGWEGHIVYTYKGGILMATSNANGYITSPELDLSTSFGKVTVKFNAKTYGTQTNCGLKVSCGNASQELTIPNNTENEYVVVLDCDEAQNQKVTIETTAKKRVVITHLDIYSGEYAADEMRAYPGEFIVTGITDHSYSVTGLSPAATYRYDVKAVYGDSQSKWSNQIHVTTLEGPAPIMGDVNCDGSVTTADVTAIYNYLLNGDETFIATSDVDGDGFITTTDITIIYNILLGQ